MGTAGTDQQNMLSIAIGSRKSSPQMEQENYTTAYSATVCDTTRQSKGVRLLNYGSNQASTGEPNIIYHRYYTKFSNPYHALVQRPAARA